MIPFIWSPRRSKWNLWRQKADPGLPGAGRWGIWLRRAHGNPHLLEWWKSVPILIWVVGTQVCKFVKTHRKVHFYIHFTVCKLYPFLIWKTKTNGIALIGLLLPLNELRRRKCSEQRQTQCACVSMCHHLCVTAALTTWKTTTLFTSWTFFGEFLEVVGHQSHSTA